MKDRKSNKNSDQTTIKNYFLRKGLTEKHKDKDEAKDKDKDKDKYEFKDRDKDKDKEMEKDITGKPFRNFPKTFPNFLKT